MSRRLWAMAAALSGLLAVAFGAFGAHGVSDAKAAEWLRTGATYQAIHALAALAAVGLGRRGPAPALFLCGTIVFSGSLYAMALGAPRLLGMVTPLGGLAFMAGWLALALALGKLEDWPRNGGNS